MPARFGRTRPNQGTALAVLAMLLAALAVVSLTAPVRASARVAPLSPGPLSPGLVSPGQLSPSSVPAWPARSVGPLPAPPPGATSLEDAAYCRSARQLSGIVYYQVLSSSTELVPVAEVHTAPNVHARLLGGRRVTVSLPAGVTADDGRWAVAPLPGASEAFIVPVDVPAFAGNQHRVVQAGWSYVTKRVICVDRDGRTGQIGRRDATPRLRYVPVGRTTGLVVGAASATVARCVSERSDAGRRRLGPGEASGLVVAPAAAYVTGMHLGGIGLPASVSVSSGSQQALRFWTSSGSSWLCGDRDTVQRSVRFYANAL